jgi:hypothetical protein
MRGNVAPFSTPRRHESIRLRYPAKQASNERKMMAVRALAGAEPVSTLATRHGVSRPLVYQQMHKANAAPPAGLLLWPVG